MRKQKSKKEYVLAYGYRRLGACQRLGWKTIPCFDASTSKVMDIPIKNIVLRDNTRMNESSAAMTELMSSIKQEGLLQPVGVSDGSIVTEADFLVHNVSENMHREDITPFELSKAIRRLQSLGLNNGEIATRLSIRRTRVEGLVSVTKVFSDKQIKGITFVSGVKRGTSNGKLPFSTAREISHVQISNKDKTILMNEAIKHELTRDDIVMVGRLISSGMNVNQAIKNRQNYRIAHIAMIVKKKEWIKLGYSTTSPVPVIQSMLAGYIPLSSEAFYFNKMILNLKNPKKDCTKHQYDIKRIK